MTTNEEGPGWLHMGEPFEIEADDESPRFVGFDRDAKAAEAHRKECGCGWPDFDWTAALYSWLMHIESKLDQRSKQLDSVDELRRVIDCRGVDFMDNVKNGHIARALLKVFDEVPPWARDPVVGFMRAFIDMDLKIRTGELQLKDFGYAEDWEYCTKCRLPFVPNQEGEEVCNRCPK